MPKNLVIVESPAKAKTIERFLGKDYKVMSSYGHIRDLKKRNYGIDPDTFEPNYEIPADKQDVVAQLRAAAKKADTIWLASDEDREGEAISWHLAEVLGLDPKEANRIVFHEITKPAIVAALAHPRHVDLNLVDAQQARRVLDRLVGFKLSPVLWRKVRPSLSAGRVQSVAVRLIVEREREIEKFQPTPSYHVGGIFKAGEGTLKAELKRRLKSKAEAKDFLEQCKDADYIISDVETKPMVRKPAAPFTTSTLQQDAARKLGFPVATTMRVAQSLYESGYITYMRTDSMNLSALFLNACGPVIEEKMGKAYHKRRQFRTTSKGAQEAHEAIRPTDIARESITGTSQEKRLYSLIWKRTIATQMADAIVERTTADIAIGTTGETFQATGESVKFDGFLKVYRESVEGENEQDAPSVLPPLKKGEKLACDTLAAIQRYSQRPTHYTEASLVHKLEELGIGRPSTYAPTISTIQQRGYVRKGDKAGETRQYNALVLKDGRLTDETREEVVGAEKGKLLPTDTGLVVNDFLMEHFGDIMDYNFTARVEKAFDEVAEGKENWIVLIKDFDKHLEPEVDAALNDQSGHRAGERILGTDPKSGLPVSVKIGRFGPMAQIGTAGEDEKPRFATLKPTQSIETITLDEALDLFKLPRELGQLDGKPVGVNAGRYGPYVVCDGLFASIPKDEDPLDITLERAVELIRQKREAEAKKVIKEFSGKDTLQILNGRFGVYISYKGENYTLPKSKAADAANLTLDECLKLVEESKEKKSTRPAGRGRRRTTTTKR